MTDDKKKATAAKANPRGLGRGLSSLLGDAGVAAATGLAARQQDATAAATARLSGLSEIPVEWINPGPWQPRRRFDPDALEELARSIRQKGVVQPILVRPNPSRKSRFDLIAGERRWRAAQKAEIHVIPAIVRDFTDAEAYEVALIENIQRADLSVIEEAQGYQKLIEEHRYTQDQLSDIVGKSRSHIANLLRLLNLPAEVQDMVIAGKLTMGQVRPLINHKDCLSLARHIIQKGLSARQVEALAKKPVTQKGAPKAKPGSASADLKSLETSLSSKLGLVVKIDWDETRERGVLKLHCESLEQMDNLLKRLQ